MKHTREYLESIKEQESIKAFLEEFRKDLSVWTTIHDGKLLGVQSVSTISICNPFCLSRMENGDSVCAECYVQSHLFKKSLIAHLIRNFELLTTRILSVDELPVFYSVYGRVESFGDIYNVTQGINYIHMIEKNPDIHFAIWSKNDAIWNEVFKITGKPVNTTYVHSSLRINVADEIKPEYAWFTDYCFTVYDFEYATTHNVRIHCGYNHCVECAHCYRKGNPFNVNEILKKDAKRYKEWLEQHAA